MPLRSPKPCSYPGCAAYTTHGSRCDAHSRGDDNHRGSAWRRGYDDDWRSVRREYLAEHPFCERQSKCGRLPMSMRLATEVHHRQTVARRPDLRLDPTNLEALCHACHSEITAREMGRVG